MQILKPSYLNVISKVLFKLLNVVVSHLTKLLIKVDSLFQILLNSVNYTCGFLFLELLQTLMRPSKMT